jgi:hypothetical protein
MASTRTVSTVRGRTGGSAGTPTEPRISPARWGGMALVFVALLAAITLAVVSPSDRGTSPAVNGSAPRTSPSPSASTLDTRLPTAPPQIVEPRDGDVLPELSIPVRVKLPEDDLSKRDLTLVILRDGEEARSLKGPTPGKTVTVNDVALLIPGPHTLTAVLVGPGGRGPVSAPVTITQDVDAPDLSITSPEDRARTYGSVITVSGTSEPGVTLNISNAANGWEQDTSVSRAGTFSQAVPLKIGSNRISVSTKGQPGQGRHEQVVVVAEDGSPRVHVKVTPGTVSRAELPRRVKVSVRATDADHQPLDGADVWFSVGGLGWEPSDFEGQTNPQGRATWSVEIKPVGTNQEEGPMLSVEVVTADDLTSEATRDIKVK